mmetsp:Transcript_12364/g.14205  ORF Transcript_12364/g.14205 Transcript_12364/m.14205 type:complete len:247 (-) Transcript_12364:102-842(-)
MVEPAGKGLKALVFGASGATGREVVSELLASPAWEQVTVVVRRKIDRWENLPEDQAKKLNITYCEDFGQLSDLSKWQMPGFDSVFCCLGTQSTKYGKKIFYQVDHDYTMHTAMIAQASKIPHYSIISSTGANHKSFAYYPKIKGQTENEIIALKLPITSIHRPGLLLHRDNDSRFMEKVAAWIPFFPKIESRDVGRVARIEAEMRHNSTLSEGLNSKLKLKNKGSEGAAVYFYENSDMLNLLRAKL